MLTTGVRTPVGIKISGADLKLIEQIGAKVEKYLHIVEGTRSVFAERTSGGYYIDVKWRRGELARHGLTVSSRAIDVGGEPYAVPHGRHHGLRQPGQCLSPCNTASHPSP